MRRELLVPLAIAFALAAAALGVILWFNRGAHMVLEGTVQKVRTLDLDGATAVIVDFRLTNPSDYTFVVRQAFVIVETGDQTLEGMVVADADAKRFFDYYKTIGPKYNDTLVMREKIPSKRIVDRMLAARFEAPEPVLAARRNLKIRVEEVDGVVTEIAEKRP